MTQLTPKKQPYFNFNPMNFNQYKVDENGVGTPMNPYNKYEVNTPNDWDRFEFYKISNTIQTVGVEPGVYDKGALKQVYQYRGILSDEWADDNFNAMKMPYDAYADYAKSLDDDAETRLVYTLKEETPTDNKESVEEAAEIRYPIPGDLTEIGKYVEYSKRHGFFAGAKWQSTQPNPELTRLKALVEKYEKALQEIEHDLDHLDRFELSIPKLRKIATNALNQ